MIGISESANRKDPATMSFLDGSKVAASIPRKSDAISPSTRPAGLIEMIAPAIVTAARDLDQSGFPLPLEEP